MRILNRRQLETWDLRWPATEPGPWLLTPAGVDAALGQRPSAIGVYWIGSSPTGTHIMFTAKYCGKTVDQPLRVRLKQHASGRGNSHVAQHLRNKRLSDSDPLWFRFVEFPTRALAEFTEGTMISAFRNEYIWNSRNEFKQQWILERLYRTEGPLSNKAVALKVLQFIDHLRKTAPTAAGRDFAYPLFKPFDRFPVDTDLRILA